MKNLRRRLIAAGALVLFCGLAQAQYLISTLAGGLPGPTAAPATSYAIPSATAVAADRFGDVYLSTTSNCVFRLDSSGNLSRWAGTCVAGFMGDGSSAVNAELNGPQGLAVDTAGNLYIADQNNQRIRKVTPAGIITTVAGTGAQGYYGDNGQATSALLNYPAGLAVDAAGNLYIADKVNNIVRKLATSGIMSGIITTIAGTPQVSGTSGDGGPATSATLDAPVSLALDSAGNLYIGDGSRQVRKVNPGGTISHVAGTGVLGGWNDGAQAATSRLSYPAALAVDSSGNLYIADEFNQVIAQVNTSGIINTYAGGGSSSADGIQATEAQINYPSGVAIDYDNNLYIAGQFSRIRIVNSGIINTVVGTNALPFSGDGGPASLAQFSETWGLALDGANNLYVVDFENYRVRKIPLNGAQAGTISTFAGTGGNADSGTNGSQATSVGVTPTAVAADSAGNVYLADIAQVRKVTPSGLIYTVAGTGVGGYNQDNIPATTALLSSYLTGLAVDSSGNLYIADYNNNRVRQVTPGGTISTIAGTGTAGFNGDQLGTSAELNYPTGLAVDAAGKNLYIADSGNCRVRKLALGTNGLISTVAGNGTCGNMGDGAAATNAEITNPWGLALDASGNLYITTEGNTVREVSSGTISTIAGTGVAGYAGDGGPATSALLNFPLGIAVDSAGNVYVSDFHNSAVRILEPVRTEPLLSVLSTHTGNFISGQNGATFNLIVSNAALAAATSGTVTVTDTLPSSLTLVPNSNSGWNCSISGSIYTCTSTSSTSIAGSIAVVADVGSGAIPQITNVVTVSGGGSPASSSEDVAFVGPANPTLKIVSTHIDPFVIGQQETYTILVENQTAAPTTSGTVTVTDFVPAALNLVSITGTGWSCGSSGNTTTCTRSDGLPGGAGYNPIAVTVSVPSSAPSSVTNSVTVSGGASASDSGPPDLTKIIGVACNVTGDRAATVVDVQAIINQALGANSAVSDLNGDNKVNVVDVQIVINAALSLGCTV